MSEQVQTKAVFTSPPKASALTGLSRTTMWRGGREGWFPKPVAISPGRVAYVTAELEAWIAERIKQREPGRRPELATAGR